MTASAPLPTWSPAAHGALYDLCLGPSHHIGAWLATDDHAGTPWQWLDWAQDRVVGQVADLLRLRPGEHVLDIGFGSGAVPLRLAATVGVAVTGCSANPVEVDAAADLATSSVHFELTGPLLPYSDAAFDAVWVKESVEQLPEARRVLRPGGRVVITVPVPNLHGLVDAVHDTGLIVEQARDLGAGPRVGRTWDMWAQLFQEHHPALFDRYGAEGIVAMDNGITVLLSVVTGELNCAVVVARDS
ncbi:SAM-dependent methyltransferase [Actinokineospora terrae]|uniref:Methyltransferase domain-containing protein n=1 Tax=Actinokineospora terrae TaxID=155974 RepID=A0A1H9SCQ6_9PSEU|nr:methyltransferase domain-containing protein [Actinokineospora terrae]SER82757.1 Methyltransferase domain-containing protein [Actinokineospora terrae]